MVVAWEVEYVEIVVQFWGEFVREREREIGDGGHAAIRAWVNPHEGMGGRLPETCNKSALPMRIYSYSCFGVMQEEQPASCLGAFGSVDKMGPQLQRREGRQAGRFARYLHPHGN